MTQKVLKPQCSKHGHPYPYSTHACQLYNYNHHQTTITVVNFEILLWRRGWKHSSYMLELVLTDGSIRHLHRISSIKKVGPRRVEPFTIPQNSSFFRLGEGILTYLLVFLPLRLKKFIKLQKILIKSFYADIKIKKNNLYLIFLLCHGSFANQLSSILI